MYCLEIKQKTRNLDKLARKIRKLGKQSVSSGYFAESGEHSNYHIKYATLMYMHEAGFEGDHGYIPSRPVRLQTYMYMQSTYSRWSRSIGDYLFRNKRMDYPLELIGKLSVQFATDLFGDSNRLVDNSEQTQEIKGANTPLVDTGELRDNWAYKTSIDNQLVTMSWG